MPKLIVKRLSEFQNRLRSIRINVNGEELGTISNGESLEFELNSERNGVQAKMKFLHLHYKMNLKS